MCVSHTAEKEQKCVVTFLVGQLPKMSEIEFALFLFLSQTNFVYKIYSWKVP